jgi:hypothetical protein
MEVLGSDFRFQQAQNWKDTHTHTTSRPETDERARERMRWKETQTDRQPPYPHRFGNMTKVLDYLNDNVETFGIQIRYSTVAEVSTHPLRTNMKKTMFLLSNSSSALQYFDHIRGLGLSFPLKKYVNFEYG